MTSAANSEMLPLADALVIFGSFLIAAYSACNSRLATICCFVRLLSSICNTRSTAACVPSCNKISCDRPPSRLKLMRRLVAEPSTALPFSSFTWLWIDTLVSSSMSAKRCATARLTCDVAGSFAILVKAARRSLFSSARTCAVVRSGLVDSTPRAYSSPSRGLYTSSIAEVLRKSSPYASSSDTLRGRPRGLGSGASTSSATIDVSLRYILRICSTSSRLTAANSLVKLLISLARSVISCSEGRATVSL